MDHDFLGRSRELAFLDRAVADPKSSFIPIYGRRRIGKSELVKHHIAKHRGLYVVGKQATAELQIRELLVDAAAAFGEPLLAQIRVEGWREALQAVVGAWKSKKKLVLALDEFQWMVESSPELPSVIQELWDRQWSKGGRLQLILCGSYIGFMEREVLGHQSPLFGRRTGQIQLLPFSIPESRLFHPSWSLMDSARAWFLSGGVPMYLRAMDTGRSIEQNIKSAILDSFGPLSREPDFLLREELRDVANYYGILMSLASGSAPIGEIAKITGVPERSLPYYLEQLVGLGYVRRRYPLDGKPPVARRVRFELDDALLRFWFRFVWPNTSYLAQMGPERMFADRIAPFLDSWYGSRFEAMAREALIEVYAAEGVAAQIGEYWDPNVQIDCVAVRDDGWIDLGECKWGAASGAIDELRAKVGKYPNPLGRTIGLRVFSTKAAPKTLPGDVRWHSLANIYGD